MLSEEILIEATITSNAKINIGLNIFDKFDSGYHILESLIQEISISDIVNIKILKSNGGIQLEAKGIDCPIEDNTCYKITNYVKSHYKIKNKIIIELHKKIPIGSGLGGGSSNAASILNFLDKTLKINITKKKKIEICKTIGMDVPFFIKGGLQYAKGMGDVTQNMPPLFKNNFFIVAMPQFKISTKWAYSKINKPLPNKKMRYNLLALEEPLKWKSFENDFEDVVIPRYPEIRVLKEAMLENGAIYSSLSGSGSAVFGIYNNYDQAFEASKKIDQKKYHITVTSPIYR